MRYYLIRLGMALESKPHVVMETCDDSYDESDGRGYEFVSRDEALRDPRWREAVRAWEARNDSEYEADEERFTILSAADEAEGKARRERYRTLRLNGVPEDEAWRQVSSIPRYFMSREAASRKLAELAG